MNVEDDRIIDANVQARALRLMEWYPWYDEESFTAQSTLDQLILAVQAEMPCYEGELEQDAEGRRCPSCTARMKQANLVTLR